MDSKALIVVGLGFGDEGKGSVVESLTRHHGAKLNVRFNGGAQTAHHVVRADGTVHCFRQFGSGTFEGAHTHLSRFHLFDPLALAEEAKSLAAKGQADAIERITIDKDAPLVTLYHIMTNQIRECARGAVRHGSCGMGIWETQRLANEHPVAIPRAGDLLWRSVLIDKLEWLQRLLLQEIEDMPMVPPRKLSALHTTPSVVADMILSERLGQLVAGEYLHEQLREDVVIFEGAQGVLLDQNLGFLPHVTGTTTLYNNAHTLLEEADFGGKASHYGVMRTYVTRHGAGPLPTEHEAAQQIQEPHNGSGEYQGSFRSGALDLALLRYAVNCLGGVDALAVTHADRPIDVCCYGYAGQDQPVRQSDPKKQAELTRALFNATPILEAAPTGLGFIAEHLQAPIGIISRGQRVSDKEFLQAL